MSNYCIKFSVATREEFLAFSQNLGRVLMQEPHDRDGPWHISVLGDGCSGKSLIALGIDSVFSPSRYEHNYISTDINPDSYLESGTVTFFNHLNLYEPSKAGFDKRLLAFQETHPEAQVLVSSNIQRTVKGLPDYSTSFNSAACDIAITVETVSPSPHAYYPFASHNVAKITPSMPFHRDITLVVRTDNEWHITLLDLTGKLEFFLMDFITKGPDFKESSSPKNLGSESFSLLSFLTDKKQSLLELTHH